MKLHEFINKYLNTKIDFDNAFGAQCVDVFRQYCKDVLNIPHTGAVEGAKDLFINYSQLPLEIKYFDKIFTHNIRKGDILIWGSSEVNKYGHVAIAVCNNDGDTVLVLEQDGFKQNGTKLKERQIKSIMGVLRFKNEFQ